MTWVGKGKSNEQQQFSSLEYSEEKFHSFFSQSCNIYTRHNRSLSFVAGGRVRGQSRGLKLLHLQVTRSDPGNGEERGEGKGMGGKGGRERYQFPAVK